MLWQNIKSLGTTSLTSRKCLIARQVVRPLRAISPCVRLPNSPRCRCQTTSMCSRTFVWIKNSRRSWQAVNLDIWPISSRNRTQTWIIMQPIILVAPLPLTTRLFNTSMLLPTGVQLKLVTKRHSKIRKHCTALLIRVRPDRKFLITKLRTEVQIAKSRKFRPKRCKALKSQRNNAVACSRKCKTLTFTCQMKWSAFTTNNLPAMAPSRRPSATVLKLIARCNRTLTSFKLQCRLHPKRPSSTLLISTKTNSSSPVLLCHRVTSTMVSSLWHLWASRRSNSPNSPASPCNSSLRSTSSRSSKSSMGSHQIVPHWCSSKAQMKRDHTPPAATFSTSAHKRLMLKVLRSQLCILDLKRTSTASEVTIRSRIMAYKSKEIRVSQLSKISQRTTKFSRTPLRLPTQCKVSGLLERRERAMVLSVTVRLYIEKIRIRSGPRSLSSKRKWWG